MLGGVSPVLIFQFSKLAGTAFGNTIAKIPLISKIPNVIEQPPIPVYLDKSLGFLIVGEGKNIDIETTMETLADGTPANVHQKGINSTISIEIQTKKDNYLWIMLSALLDSIVDRTSSREYAITYLNGPITVFRGLLQSYVVNPGVNDDLLSIQIQLTRGDLQPNKIAGAATVPGAEGAIP